MTDLPALRSELDDALAALEPRIRGLGDLAAVPASAQLTLLVQEELTRHNRRRDRIRAAAAALDALAADGYPDLAATQIPPNLFRELTGEASDMDAGRSTFAAEPEATQLSVTLGPTSPA